MSALRTVGPDTEITRYDAHLLHGGHFLGGHYVYAKRWTTPTDFRDKHFSLLFDGVQGLTRVLVNGTDVGGSVNGYTEFEVNLDTSLTDGENLIEVRVDNSGTNCQT